MSPLWLCRSDSNGDPWEEISHFNENSQEWKGSGYRCHKVNSFFLVTSYRSAGKRIAESQVTTAWYMLMLIAVPHDLKWAVKIYIKNLFQHNYAITPKQIEHNNERKDVMSKKVTESSWGRCNVKLHLNCERGSRNMHYEHSL